MGTDQLQHLAIAPREPPAAPVDRNADHQPGRCGQDEADLVLDPHWGEDLAKEIETMQPLGSEKVRKRSGAGVAGLAEMPGHRVLIRAAGKELLHALETRLRRIEDRKGGAVLGHLVVADHVTLDQAPEPQHPSPIFVEVARRLDLQDQVERGTQILFGEVRGTKWRLTRKMVHLLSFKASKLGNPVPGSIRWRAAFLEADQPADAIPNQGHKKFKLTA